MISPDPVAANNELKENLKLDKATILSDHETNMEVIKAYGVHDTKSLTAKLFHRIKETSKPSTFILDQNRKVLYAFSGKNYMNRPKNKDLIAFLSS